MFVKSMICAAGLSLRVASIGFTITLSVTGCGSGLFESLGEKVKDRASSVQCETEYIMPLPTPRECPPGAKENVSINCPEGGLLSYTFHVKDRRRDAGNNKLSFYTIEGEKIASSENFVIFRDSAESARMDSSDADDILRFLEENEAYSALSNIYGEGTAPDVQGTGRVVILVYDIKDDYSMDNPAYVGGYFAPRDLFADDFTSSLFSYPENIEDPIYGNLSEIESAENLKGYSNENQMIHMDIHPFFDGTAAEDPAKAKELFRESILHEASHLFTYYKRVIENRKRNHLVWIAEGIAEQAPQVVSGGTASQEERMDQYSLPLVQSLLAEGPSLLDMDATGNVLTGYLQTNLFYNYLRHRAGTPEGAEELLAEIVGEGDYAVSGVENVLGIKIGGTFGDVFGDWVITNWLSGTGRNISSLTDEAGSAVPLGDGSRPSRRYDLSYSGAGIAPKGKGGLSFLENSVPLCYEGLKCVPPAAYLYFEYTPSVNENYIPYNDGMEEGLKVVLIHLDPNGTDGDVSLHDYDAELSLTAGETYNIAVYNPSYSGECLSTGLLPWDSRNLAKWIGGGKNGWQTGTGAVSKNADKFFYRGRGLAVIRNGDGNYIYTADSMSHSVAKWDIDSGSYAGRYGSSVTDMDCSGDDSVAPGWISRPGKLVNNYCRRSLSSPQGVAVDFAGNVYVADTLNHRIVKVDKDGAFAAWLGHNSDDTWQGESDHGPMSLSDLIAAGYITRTSMFQNPWGIVIDEGNDYFYVTNYGSNRITRRRLSDGAYMGFIGNGMEGWNTTEVNYNNNYSGDRKYFRRPRGLAIDGKYLYVADEENHRISRWTLGGYHREDTTLDETKVWIGGETDGWHHGGTDAGEDQGKRSFHYPGDVALYGDYLYVADRKNQRIARWNKNSGDFSGWIGGGVTQWETMQDGPPQEPVGSAYEYPPIFMLEPLGLAADDSSHLYLYVTTVYNGRVSRWNLDCVEDNASGSCYGE